jgi:hypothetical protein
MGKQIIDVVYVLGTGSRWNDNEIRFSLRSIEKNLRNFRNVYIVGHCPEFLQNVIHIKSRDVFDPGKNADGNIIKKVLLACKEKGLSDDFLFINDDHLVLKPIQVSKVPSFHKGDMKDFPAEYWKLNFWRSRLRRTFDALLLSKLSTLHFDCHTPILFNKLKFPEIISAFNYQDDIGYTMKSLYGNVMYPNAPLLTNQKRTVFRPFTRAELSERFRGPQFLSFNDQGLNASLKWWLIEKFPAKSGFEKDTPSDRIFELFDWLKSGKDYQKGVAIFQRYYKGVNIIRMFKMGETPVLRKKLEFKILQTINRL